MDAFGWAISRKSAGLAGVVYRVEFARRAGNTVMADNEHAIHELIASTRELSNLIRIHEADIASLKAKVENNLRQSERLESMVHQIGDDVSAVRSDVTNKVNEMQLAVMNHIQSDEVAQNRILKTIIIAAFVNGLAVIVWLASSWVDSGMPWPIFPWL